MKILAIIPTYQEAENIEKLLQAFSQYCPYVDIIFIDDSENDTTIQSIKKYSILTKSKVDILHRKKKLGLGSAYKEGFTIGLQKEYDVFLQMDADLSHHPKYINTMAEKIQLYDVVIGSRFIKGGDVINWPWHRKLLSHGGNIYARYILGTTIKDFTGGFNMWKRKTLEIIDLDQLESQGYSFQIELKYRAWLKQQKFYEIPILFQDRVAGESKLGKNIIKEAIFKVLQLKLNKNLH